MQIKETRVDVISYWSNGIFLGSINVESYAVRSVWLSMLYVVPEFRRKRVATELIEVVENRFLKDMYMEPKPFGDCPLTPEQLIEWYKSIGFTPVPNENNLYVKKAK